MNNDDFVRIETACKTVLPRFRSVSRDIWGKNIDNIVFKCEPKTVKEHHFASLSRDERCVPWAMNRRLLRYCKEYTLQLSPRFLGLSEGRKDRILRHESLHIGYPRHTVEFMEVASEVGACFSESSIDKNEIIIEAKTKDSREQYVPVLTASSPSEAKRLATEYALENRDKQVRITY